MAWERLLLRERTGVAIATKLEDAFQPVLLSERVHCYLLPYFRAPPRHGRCWEWTRGFQEAYRAVLDRVRERFVPGAVNVLAAHCFVMGGGTSARKALLLSGSSEVPACFEGFSYVALGHATGREGGAKWPMPVPRSSTYSFDEAHHRKSVTMVTFEEEQVKSEAIPGEPLRDLRTLSGTMEELLELGKRASSEGYLCRITDDSWCTCPWIACAPIFPTFWGINSYWLSRAGAGESAGLQEQLLHHRTDDASILKRSSLNLWLGPRCGGSNPVFAGNARGGNMKPISVTMQAFGSYFEADKPWISARAEGTIPSFLITGATGGGKTTILDAMCFALYCKATGGRQLGQYAPPQLRRARRPWSILSSSWRARRTVFMRSQSQYAARGTGALKTKETHACYRMEAAEWELLLSGAESSRPGKAEEILGLTCEQFFPGHWLLPPGGFLKLLLSSSRDKAQMFQTLFATGRWERAGAMLKGRWPPRLANRRASSRRQKALHFGTGGVETLPLLEEKEAALREQLVRKARRRRRPRKRHSKTKMQLCERQRTF